MHVVRHKTRASSRIRRRHARALSTRPVAANDFRSRKISGLWSQNGSGACRRAQPMADACNHDAKVAAAARSTEAVGITTQPGGKGLPFSALIVGQTHRSPMSALVQASRTAVTGVSATLSAVRETCTKPDEVLRPIYWGALRCLMAALVSWRLAAAFFSRNRPLGHDASAPNAPLRSLKAAARILVGQAQSGSKNVAICVLAAICLNESAIKRAALFAKRSVEGIACELFKRARA